MTVRELMRNLLEYPIDANVEIEVHNKDNAIYCGTDKIETIQISDRRVLIQELMET